MERRTPSNRMIRQLHERMWAVAKLHDIKESINGNIYFWTEWEKRYVSNAAFNEYYDYMVSQGWICDVVQHANYVEVEWASQWVKIDELQLSLTDEAMYLLNKLQEKEIIFK